MSTLGSRIRNLREVQNIQQNEFAKKIGVSNVVLSRYESGERKPDYETLEKIADYFEVTTDYLLGREFVQSPGRVNRHTSNQNKNLSIDDEFEAFANNPELERWYKDLPNSEEEDLEALKQMWEIIKRNRK